MQVLEASMSFMLGDRVRFETMPGSCLTGKVIEANKTKVKVIVESGPSPAIWVVPVSLVERE